MKKFIIRFIIFAILFFIVDKLFIVIRNIAPKYDHDKRLELVLNGQMNHDLIVIGSSRGNADIAPWIIKDSLNLDVYNLSYGGSEIEFQTFLLKLLLKYNKKPKAIIKIIDDPFELLYSKNNQFRVDRLYPLMKYEDIRNELIKRGVKSKVLSRFFMLHQLNKINFNIKAPPVLNDTIINFGSLPGSGSRDSLEFTKSNNVYDKDKELISKLDCFNLFQRTCLNNNIQVIYVIPPSYTTINDAFLSRMNNLIDSRCFLYLYDQNNKIYQDRALFRDPIHLNKNGAIQFTNELINVIKNEVNIGIQ